MLNKKKTAEVENNTVIILLQSCSVRDPDSGFLFNLQPLATEKGYTTTGIGKTYLVRILTVQSVAYGFCCCFFFFFWSYLVSYNFYFTLLRDLSWQKGIVLKRRIEDKLIHHSK